MSKMHTDKITCPKCGNKHDFTFYDSVNTELDPDLKRDVRTGELFRFECPYCGTVADVVYQCLYHQVENRAMIFFIPNGETEEAERLFKDSKNRSVGMPGLDAYYKKRIVTTMNDFKEKLKLLDEDLDDRAVEIMKCLLRIMMAGEEPEHEIQNMYFDKTKDGKRFFYCLLKDEDPIGLQYDRALYEQVIKDFQPIFDADDSVIIDQQWAAKCIEKQK